MVLTGYRGQEISIYLPIAGPAGPMAPQVLCPTE